MASQSSNTLGMIDAESLGTEARIAVGGGPRAFGAFPWRAE